MAETMAQRATRDVSDAKAHALTTDEVKAVSEILGKCINPVTGKPVSARREDEAVLPVAGSKKDSDDGNGTGTCPECGAHVRLSGKGFLTAHSIRRTPVPAPAPTVRLAERQAEVTDTGARVGSPDASMRTREAELGAAAGTAPVTIRVKGADGKMTDAEVPATADNIRTAIRQQQRRKSPDTKLLAKLGSMLRGATGTVAVPVIGAQPGTYKVREAVTLDAPNAPEGREERQGEDGRNGHVPTAPGPALVQGGAMSGEVPTDRARQTRKGMPRNAIGWSGPLGRPRPDRVALVGNAEACGGKACKIDGCVAVVGGRYGYLECHVYRAQSKSRQRRYWEHVATAKARAERAAELSQRPRVATGRGHVTGKSMGGPGIRRV
jgi:hypothetical protein